MTMQTNLHSVIGMLHAQELLTLSVIRALPPEVRGRIADELKANAELSTQPQPSASAERDALEAFRTHVKRLSILLTSMS
ncbi:hypothetical protein [Trinickia sp.]|uniref:hypothetical protein n=1 Tax=Trinickia sp. TaxID=2571163 RepID=UPI003F81524A